MQRWYALRHRVQPTGAGLPDGESMSSTTNRFGGTRALRGGDLEKLLVAVTKTNRHMRAKRMAGGLPLVDYSRKSASSPP